MTDIRCRVEQLKKKKNAVILAHTYQPAEVQDIADYVGDSYGLSVKARQSDADIIVFCGVMFMAETAAILNPQKKVIIPEASAGCPMADMISPAQLSDFRSRYPGYTTMCYVNSTAETKAESDICCTSSNAVKIAVQIPKQKGIIFVPDKHLGTWVREQTGHEMAIWPGYCPVHVRISPDMILQAKKNHPTAEVLIHPEAPHESRIHANAVLSTGQMCSYVKESSAPQFIIATETGIINTLKKQNPDKKFFAVDNGITCVDMKRGSLRSTLAALENRAGALVTVPKEIADRASLSLERMLEMSK